MKTPTLIASYPRSGSTYLRFLLTNLLYPDQDHDINSVNKHIPTIESKEEVLQGISSPRFYKTHELRNPANSILLHRHVGDCLVSEYHYHKDYHDYEGSMSDFLKEVDYGNNWRCMIDHYYPCRSVSFDYLIKKPVYALRAISDMAKIYPPGCSWVQQYEKVVEKCNFDYLQKQDNTFFRSGKVDQWKKLNAKTREKILEKNWMHLKILGYKI